MFKALVHINNAAQAAVNLVVFFLWSRLIWPFWPPTFVVLLGAPGSGKGTLAEALSRLLGVPQLSTGEVYRRELKNDTAIGRLVAQCMKLGTLAPDFLTFVVMLKELRFWRYRHGAILDGFPRNVAQAELLAQFLTARGIKLRKVVALEVPEEELIKRLLARGRADDVLEVIQRRMEVYRLESGPLVPFYQSAGSLLIVALPGADKEEVLNFVTARI